MKSQIRSTRMWGVMVASLYVLCFAASAGAIPLESWDDKIQNVNKRFKVLSEFNGEAVLDKETQLVWEQSPATNLTSWVGARNQCIFENIGGRKGWRMPSIPELASLIDPSVVAPGPMLPPGHPFLNVQAANYWSATTVAGFPTEAWAMPFNNGFVGGNDKTNNNQFWCVRGHMNAEAY